ncbi:hypothetical protein BGZ89_011409, partial [Linnemannia elongata]
PGTHVNNAEMEPAKDRTPFNITELRHRISLFATVKDALSCALVFKTWARDYLPVIWSQVDFDSEPQFANLTTKTITKHGKFMHIVKNAMVLPLITVLVNGGVNRLKDHHIETTAFRCSICALMSSALVPSYSSTQGPSKLKYLSIDTLCLTLDNLVAILQGCSTVSELKLVRTDIVGSPTVSSCMIKELLRFYPLLTDYHLEGHDGAIIPKFLNNIFSCNGNNNNISKITSKYEHTTVEAITAIYLHQASLKFVATYYRRSCPKPQVIDLHYHKMDMDIVEPGGWVCKNLMILHIRIKVLDTRARSLRLLHSGELGIAGDGGRGTSTVGSYISRSRLASLVTF